MAKLFLTPADTNYRISNGNTKVFGSNNAQTIILDAGLKNVEVDSNVAGIEFTKPANDFIFLQMGNSLLIYDSESNLVARVGIQDDSDGSKLAFSDKTVSAKFEVNSTTGVSLELDGAALPKINSIPNTVSEAKEVLNEILKEFTQKDETPAVLPTTPEPEPTPDPSTEPAPTPAPEPTPVPEPSPTPTPEPDSSPAPTPTSTFTVNIADGVVSWNGTTQGKVITFGGTATGNVTMSVNANNVATFSRGGVTATTTVSDLYNTTTKNSILLNNGENLQLSPAQATAFSLDNIDYQLVRSNGGKTIINTATITENTKLYGLSTPIEFHENGVNQTTVTVNQNVTLSLGWFGQIDGFTFVGAGNVTTYNGVGGGNHNYTILTTGRNHMVAAEDADIITTGAGENEISGGVAGSSDRINLASGAGTDRILIRVGDDTRASDSSFVGMDTVTNFVVGTDKFDVLIPGNDWVWQSAGVPTSLTRVADTVITTNLATTLAATFSSFSANTAGIVVITDTADAGTYLYVNDSDAAYNETKDIFVKLNNLSGLGSVGSLTVSDYFVASMGNNSGSGNNQSNSGGSTSGYANPLVTAPEPQITKVKMASAVDSNGSSKTGILTTGDVATATVTFSEPVTVSSGSVPTLKLQIGDTLKEATYASGSGTNTLSFSYQIVTDDNDTNGISFPANGLQTAGTIKDADGNDALLNFNARVDNYKFKVDTLAPTATEQFPIVYFNGGNGAFNLNLSERINSNALTVNDFSVAGKTLGDGASISINNQAYVNQSNITINLGSNATVAKDDVLSIGTGKVVDLAGNSNTAPLTFTVPEMTAPVITNGINISRDYSQQTLGSKLSVGHKLKFSVSFNENVTISGSPTLAVNIGGETKQATLLSTNLANQNYFEFGYTIQDGDNDADGISIDAGSISLNGGSIKDADNNDAILSYPATQSSWIKVDTTAPTAALTNPVAVIDMNADDTLNAGDTIQLNLSESVLAWYQSNQISLSEIQVANGHSFGDSAVITYVREPNSATKGVLITLGANSTVATNDTINVVANAFYDDGGNNNSELSFTMPANQIKTYTVASFNNGTGLSANDYVYLYDTKANIQAALPELISHIDLLDVVKQSDNEHVVMSKTQYEIQGVANVFDSAKVAILAQNYDDLSGLGNLNYDDMIDIPHGANVRLTSKQAQFAKARDVDGILPNDYWGNLTGAGDVIITNNMTNMIFNISMILGLSIGDELEIENGGVSLTAEQLILLSNVLTENAMVDVTTSSTGIVANPEINNYTLTGSGANTITLTSPTQTVTTANHNSEQIVKTGDLTSWSGNFQGNSTATDILEVEKSMAVSNLHSIDKIRLSDGVELTLSNLYSDSQRTLNEISGVEGGASENIVLSNGGDFAGITLTDIDTIKSSGSLSNIKGANKIQLESTNNGGSLSVRYSNVDQFGDVIDATNSVNGAYIHINSTLTSDSSVRSLGTAGNAGSADSAQGVATFVNAHLDSYSLSTDLTTGSAAYLAVKDDNSWAVYRYVAADGLSSTVDATELTLVAQVVGSTTIQAFIIS